MSEADEDIEVTGERFIPEVMGGELIDAEHQSRYRFALPHVRGRTVLDAGCGVGWGTALLLAAGAAAVTGVDIDPETVAAAGRRTPQAAFAVGDLLDLPLPDDSFDVVVCFEAVEHTGDTERTLDELVRVLRPGGLLFVSSPNPAVYPAGNPFHRNEETPETLRHIVSVRLRNAQLFRQHLLVASVLVAEGESSLSSVPAHCVAPLTAGRDPYSLVIGSDGELTGLEPFAAFAPSHQLDQLIALSGEFARVSRENSELLAQIDRSQRDANLEQLRALTVEATARADEASTARTARDSYAAMVLASEQDLAQAEQERRRLEHELTERSHAFAIRERDLDEVLRKRGAELDVIYGSRSWRATGALRDAARHLRSRR